jgi:hypothetical protein
MKLATIDHEMLDHVTGGGATPTAQLGIHIIKDVNAPMQAITPKPGMFPGLNSEAQISAREQILQLRSLRVGR